jgi:hypothetical protein
VKEHMQNQEIIRQRGNGEQVRITNILLLGKLIRKEAVLNMHLKYFFKRFFIFFLINLENLTVNMSVIRIMYQWF